MECKTYAEYRAAIDAYQAVIAAIDNSLANLPDDKGQWTDAQIAIARIATTARMELQRLSEQVTVNSEMQHEDTEISVSQNAQ